jgi:hypothetical protein
MGVTTPASAAASMVCVLLLSSTMSAEARIGWNHLAF